jgi:hypothetical protein
MKTTLSLLALLLLLAPRPAAAQGAFVAPYVGFDFGGDAKCAQVSNCEDKTTNFGVAVGSLGSIAGFEEEFGYAKDFFGKTTDMKSSVLTLMSNLVVGPKIKYVRPYGVIGLGLIKTNVDLTPSGLLNMDNNSLGWDLGGGLMVGAGRIGVRGDVRYFHAFKDLEFAGFTLNNTKLDFGRASVGLVLGF